MGGIGATALGLAHADEFDAIAALGGPLDAALFFRGLEKFYLSGFCSKEDLEEILQQAPERLNDPEVIDACSKRTSAIRYERSQDFNHWAFSLSGGVISRDTYLNMFVDLTLAHGGFIYENPESSFAPPGVPYDILQRTPADFCTHPVRVKGLRNAEYNPDGRYEAITFCDGQPKLYLCRQNQERVNFCSDRSNIAHPLTPDKELAFAEAYCQNKGGAVEATKRDHAAFLLKHGGQVDPCRLGQTPMKVALALDMNSNGRRDYGEPIVVNAQERYSDVGQDGCSDAFEDGLGGCLSDARSEVNDANRDNFDLDLNSQGAEGNFMFDVGEPFRDHGLDGVPETHDFGEGNGVFDLSSGRRSILRWDVRENLRRPDLANDKHLSFYLDGGKRDVFNFGLSAQHVFSSIKTWVQPSAEYQDFAEIPYMVDKRNGYSPWNKMWKHVPRNLLVLYGNEEPSESEWLAGEGDHVGSTAQANYRFSTLFNWSAATWPELPTPPTPSGLGSSAERQAVKWFFSDALNAKWEYAIALPPGYDQPEFKDVRYPVLFMLHGYGMEPSDMLALSSIADLNVVDSEVKFRPMIMVFPSGRCCYRNRTTGERDCRSANESGQKFDALSDFEKECQSGTFYINSKGFRGEDGAKYGDAFFELVRHVDQNYRTLSTGP